MEGFFETSIVETETRLVDGVASAFKVSKFHLNPSEVGFCITRDNLIRAEWKRVCPSPSCDVNSCSHFLGCKRRDITTNTKKLESFDIGTNWLSILGITPKRKYDLNTKRYAGIWQQKDWEELKRSSQAEFKPHSHVRVLFLHPQKFEPIHQNPIQIKLDGMFGSTFERKLANVDAVVIPKIRALSGGLLTEKDELRSHVPLCVELVQQAVSSTKVASAQSLACIVKGFRYADKQFDTVAIKVGSELGATVLDRVRETRDWISSIGEIEEQGVEDYEEERCDPMNPENSEILRQAREGLCAKRPAAVDGDSPKNSKLARIN